MTYEIVTLLLGTLGISAAWDAVRRWSDKAASQELRAAVDKLSARVSDLEPLRTEVVEARRLLLNLKNAADSAKNPRIKFG